MVPPFRALSDLHLPNILTVRSLEAALSALRAARQQALPAIAILTVDMLRPDLFRDRQGLFGRVEMELSKVLQILGAPGLLGENPARVGPTSSTSGAHVMPRWTRWQARHRRWTSDPEPKCSSPSGLAMSCPTSSFSKSCSRPWSSDSWPRCLKALRYHSTGPPKLCRTVSSACRP